MKVKNVVTTAVSCKTLICRGCFTGIQVCTFGCKEIADLVFNGSPHNTIKSLESDQNTLCNYTKTPWLTKNHETVGRNV